MIHAATNRLRALRYTKSYDLLAAAPLIAWYLFVIAQLLPGTAQQIALIRLFVRTDIYSLPISVALDVVAKICSLAFLAVLVVLFTVRRPPKRRAGGFYARVVAIAGTWIPAGIAELPPQQISPLVYFVSLLLLIAGTAFAIYAATSLARSISIMPEARQLVTRGPYSIVRHPLYLGEMIATGGLALQYLMPWAAVLLALHCFFQFERMKREERLLVEAFGDYGEYMARTARLLPGLY